MSCSGDLILCFDHTKMVADYGTSTPTQEPCATIVECDYNVAEIGSDVRLEVNVEAVRDCLRVGSTILVEKDRVLVGRVKVWWSPLKERE